MSDPTRTDLRGVVLALVVGVVGVAAALGLSRASGPKSPEDVAVAHARSLRAQGKPSEAFDVLRQCSDRDLKACRCMDEAAEVGVDMGRHQDAWRIAKRGFACMNPRHMGAVAEALVGTGRASQGVEQADKALALDPNEPHACFAKAWALSLSGSSADALPFAEKAVAGGRGLPALLLLATLRSTAGDARGARAAIDQAERVSPREARVLLDRGVLEQGEHHYREAREAYLQALKLDPNMADARYNLAVLTHSVKADDEARHNLDELVAIAPSDPRIPQLREMLQSK